MSRARYSHRCQTAMSPVHRHLKHPTVVRAMEGEVEPLPEKMGLVEAETLGHEEVTYLWENGDVVMYHHLQLQATGVEEVGDMKVAGTLVETTVVEEVGVTEGDEVVGGEATEKQPKSEGGPQNKFTDRSLFGIGNARTAVLFSSRPRTTAVCFISCGSLGLPDRVASVSPQWPSSTTVKTYRHPVAGYWDHRWWRPIRHW